MSVKITINTTEGPIKVDPIFEAKDALFMRPYATPVQVTEAIFRAHQEVLDRHDELMEGATAETLAIILEFHLDDVLGHGEEPAFTGE
jgi:hypothetical protein